MDISESMKKEIIRNGIIASTLGIALLVGVNSLEEQEEVPEQSHSYDDYLSKYSNNKVRGNFNLNLAQEFIHNGRVLKFKKEQTAKLRKVIKLEKEQKERERLVLIEKQKQEKKKQEAKEKWITIEASYYTARCKGCTGITKTEVNVRNTTTYQGMRIIATDPNVIPLWSIVEIKSNKGSYKAISLDIGGVIRGKKIDVLVGTTQEALNLGRHDVQVRILRKGK